MAHERRRRVGGADGGVHGAADRGGVVGSGHGVLGGLEELPGLGEKRRALARPERLRRGPPLAAKLHHLPVPQLRHRSAREDHTLPGG